MAEEQDNVTPEEKLLNVIQNGGEEAATPEEKPVEAAAAPVAEVATAEEKPALKLAKKDDAADVGSEPAPEAAKAVSATEEAPAAVSTAAASVVSSKKKGGEGSGIKIINRMLAAGVLIMLGLSCFEVFAVIKASGNIKPPVMLELPDQKEFTVSMAEVIEAYTKDAFWRQKAGPDGGSQTTTTTITVSTTPWAQELKSFKLMGVSMKEPKADSEAILLDSRNNKMYFVRLGNSFPLLDGNVRLEDIEAGRARFTDGASSVELK